MGLVIGGDVDRGKPPPPALAILFGESVTGLAVECAVEEQRMLEGLSKYEQ
ncbi:hypothetical protein M8C21_033433 [Ambrosia artemisiifolia]|uniref:Uncharacterized protein n=1 Tax=Ambrosia artemisiifolia TaxID=4212 RepID=A0AAD5D6Q0_AMBAR|nr:hypothetical protein M8C21_033433 [Ambrosia artemisiifolia]